MFGLMGMGSDGGGLRPAVEGGADAGVEALRRDGVRGRPDVSALACLRGRTLGVLLWHYHDDDLPGPSAAIDLTIDGLPAPAASGTVLLQHYRIDRDHSNAFETWKRMGSPQRPTPEQYAELQRSSQLALLGSPEWLHPAAGTVKLRVALPRQAVSLLVLDWGRAPH
jgi:xylan 1,4-beta-xylosidase